MSALPKTIERLDEGAEQRVVLHGVAWEEYEQIQEALKLHPGARLAYCEGALEIMTVSFEHEKISGYINDIIRAIALEWKKDFVSANTTTFQLEKRERSFEADGSYYFTNVRKMRA